MADDKDGPTWTFHDGNIRWHLRPRDPDEPATRPLLRLASFTLDSGAAVRLRGLRQKLRIGGPIRS